MATNGSPELLIVMGPEATPDQTDHVVARLEEAGVDARVSRGREATVIGAIGDRELLATLPVEGYPGVEQVVPITQAVPARRARARRRPDRDRGRRPPHRRHVLRADRRAVQRREPRADAETARAVAAAGATMLRGGAFKPRTSPYTFQGLGLEALELLKEAKAETGLPIVTELMDPRHVEEVVEATDVIQIGARNSQNFLLLVRGRARREAGASQARPRRARSRSC